MAKSAAKAPTKSEVYTSISKKTGLSRKQVASVFEGLSEAIGKTLKKGGPGLFTLPGLAKIKVVNKPAVPAGERMNPFTKTMKMMPAKPARRAIKVRPLKALKDMVA
jgi:nucleoid DNA-binding protein